MARHTLPYGRQIVDEDDIKEVIEVLRSDWLTTGPKVEEFEESFAHFVGAGHAVAVSSGTAALHCATYALGIGLGDEVIVPPMTFAATANCVVYQGGSPVFVDVDPGALLLDPVQAKRKLTPRTKAIIAVDYAGQPCDYDVLRSLAEPYGIPIVADACHSLGAVYKGRNVGTLADLTCFSFHPVKHITTGEGGMVVTDNPDLAERMRCFRNHGITSSQRQRELRCSWFYEMEELGFNYRITDFQCALGISQLRKLPGWLKRRRDLAAKYDEALAGISFISPLAKRDNLEHAYHLYVIRLHSEMRRLDRDELFRRLREKGIGVNVHYIPVHLHPFYRRRLGGETTRCPVAETAFKDIISLPLYPGLTDVDIECVISSLLDVLKESEE